MVAERSHWILRGRGAVRVRHWSDGRVPNRSKVERKQAFASQLQVVKRGDLHDEIMWMLSVGDWLSEGCFSLLEEYRITAFCHGRRLETQHGACREKARPERTLDHAHKPVC